MLRIVEEAQGGILRSHCKVCAVISNDPKAKGLRQATLKDIPALCIPSQGLSRADFEHNLLSALKEWDPDFLILAGFMRILSPDFVSKFPRRIVNIHPADTKLHQGLHGYQWAFENKLKKTKVTVHYVNEDLDQGEIIDQEDVDLEKVSSEDEVIDRGLKVEHAFYSKVLKKVFAERVENSCVEY